MIDSLAPQVPQSAVPQGYAEKAMASLMQLHTELMDEKERRVELYRRLMEREQSLAELRSYTKALEEKLAALAPPKEPAPPPAPAKATPPPPLRVATRVEPAPARSYASVAPRIAPVEPRPPAVAPVAPRPAPARPAVAVGAGRAAAARSVPDGWKTW